MPTPVIVVTDSHHVTLDGQPAGSVVDVIANHANDAANPDHAAFRGALHDALVAWHKTLRDSHKADVQARADAQEKLHQENLSALDQAKADYTATVVKQREEHGTKFDAAMANATTMIRDLQAQVDALGGTELARQLAREKRHAAAATTKAKADAEFAAATAALTITPAPAKEQP